MNDHRSTLNRFVLRARRIEAHSLATDREALLALSKGTRTGHINLDGTMRMRRTLPEEEVFESLAARVRPLLLKSESVHHGKVLKAIRRSIDAAEFMLDQERLDCLTRLEDDWSSLDLDTNSVLRFAIQSTTVDGSETTPQVSDTQLAAAWLYGDLVHADTRGSKNEGRLFPIKERYSAAVSFFAHAVTLCLATLDLVRVLRELGVIDLDEASCEEPVVVGTEELVEESVAYVGPVGSAMPDLDIATRELPEGFRRFTVTDLLRQTASNLSLVTWVSA